MENSLFSIFEQLDDPRDIRGKKYRLIDILILAIYGTLIGFVDFANMAYYLKKRESELVEVLGLAAGVPSHDTFSAVFRAIDVEKFMNLFIEWTKSIFDMKNCHIAIDGKAVRAATRKAEDGNIPYVINAFLCDLGISIGQKEIGEKANEITEIPNLIDLLDIKDSVITVDAIGTQTSIMKKIKEKKGHFCLQLKNNQKFAFESIDLYYKELDKDELEQLSVFSTTEKDHGRIEKRIYRLIEDKELVKELLPDEKWNDVVCIGIADLQREVKGEITKEVHYHIMDFTPTVKNYSEYARKHWMIENNLHWVLDMHFGEDRCTANSDRAISNLTLLRKIVFNITKLDEAMAKKTTKKKMIDFMTDINLFKRYIFEIMPKVQLNK